MLSGLMKSGAGSSDYDIDPASNGIEINVDKCGEFSLDDSEYPNNVILSDAVD